MFAFQKFQPVHQTADSPGGIISDLVEGAIAWRAARRKQKATAPAGLPDLLTLADAARFREMPVLALPPPVLRLAPPAPKRAAKRRGKYRAGGKLYWVLEVDGRVVTTTAGNERRFPTKAAALAFNA